MTGWNLPPGVSGNEPEIAGFPEACERCGGDEMVTMAGGGEKCLACGHINGEPFDPRWDDSDDARDRRDDR